MCNNDPDSGLDSTRKKRERERKSETNREAMRCHFSSVQSFIIRLLRESCPLTG